MAQTDPTPAAPDERDEELDVLRAVIARLGQQVAQQSVTIAELDARLQREVAVRAVAERPAGGA